MVAHERRDRSSLSNNEAHLREIAANRARTGRVGRRGGGRRARGEPPIPGERRGAVDLSAFRAVSARARRRRPRVVAGAWVPSARDAARARRRMGGCMEDSYLLCVIMPTKTRTRARRVSTGDQGDALASNAASRAARLLRSGVLIKQTSARAIWREAGDAALFPANTVDLPAGALRRFDVGAMARGKDGLPRMPRWYSTSCPAVGRSHGRNAGAWTSSTFVSARFPNELEHPAIGGCESPPASGLVTRRLISRGSTLLGDRNPDDARHVRQGDESRFEPFRWRTERLEDSAGVSRANADVDEARPGILSAEESQSFNRSPRPNHARFHCRLPRRWRGRTQSADARFALPCSRAAAVLARRAAYRLTPSTWRHALSFLRGAMMNALASADGRLRSPLPVNYPRWTSGTCSSSPSCRTERTCGYARRCSPRFCAEVSSLVGQRVCQAGSSEQSA